jgi:superfamily II DNA/RNA helicase
MDQNWLKKVEYLFIDEADRVLKENGIEKLIRSVQKIRRTAMFSATLQTLNEKNFDFYGMRNLAKISLKQTSTTSTPNTQSSSALSSTNEDKKYIIPKSLTNTYLKMPSRV